MFVEAKYGSLMYLVDMVCLVWRFLVLVVNLPSCASNPLVMPNILCFVCIICLDVAYEAGSLCCALLGSLFR